MKILHIGGLNFSTAALAGAQRAAGHMAQCAGISPAYPPLHFTRSDPRFAHTIDELLAENFDIAHFHALPDLKPQDDLRASSARPTVSKSTADPAASHGQLIEALRRSGVPVVYAASSRELLARHTASAEYMRSFFSTFSHIFLTRSEQLPLLGNSRKWSWLPLAVDFQTFAPPTTGEPEAQSMKILHVPFDFSPDDTDSVIEAVARLRSRGLRFHFTFSSPNEFKTEADLISAIGSADLFIEDLQSSCPGPLAILAMSLGKTVISGNSKQAREAWTQLNDCPVLHTDRPGIFKRLESLVREPRSLRDIGKRSRAYVERFHDARLVAAQTLEVYKRLISAPAERI